MMQEIYSTFAQKRAAYLKNRDRLEKPIYKHKQSLEKLETKHPGWYEDMLVPLADAISNRLCMPYEVYGPFGLCARTTVYFFPGEGHDITRDETFSITLQPGFDFDNPELLYETGEKSGVYRNGSIADMNGMNNVTSPLPDSLDAIIALLNHSEHEARERT